MRPLRPSRWRAAAFAPWALVVGCLAACSDDAPQKPVAGLHSAAAAVRRVGDGPAQVFSVGSLLMPKDRLEARGPAVVEYFGGAVVFLERGDALTVGGRDEARLVGSNLPQWRLSGGGLREAPGSRPVIAGRYVTAQLTPETASRELGTGDYLAAFFTPNGISKLGKQNGQLPEGPRRKLPPPPHRAKVPAIHAGALGGGGVIAEVTDGFVAAETPLLSTAILLEGDRYELGVTSRLLLPDGAEVTLVVDGGRPLELEGPAELRLD